MRKLFLLAFVTAVTITQSNAQVAIKPGVGLNLTDYSKDPTTGEYSAKGGFHIGGTVAFGKKFYFEPGLFYTVKTTEGKTTGTNPTTTTIDLKGFRVPVGVGINLIGNEKSILDIHIFGGGSAFFLTSNSGVPATISLNKTSFGTYAGAGIDIWKFFIDASYEWSLSNIQKDINQVDIGKTRSMFITAGLRLNF